MVSSPPTVKPTVRDNRPKSTISLNDLFKEPAKEEFKNEIKEQSTIPKDQAFTAKELKEVWDEFAEKRKDQAAEYHLLQQPYEWKDNLITLHLTNPVEEPLLQSLRPTLVEYLRDRLKNNSIQVTGSLKEIATRKIAYTNKEKFDLMLEKNPALLELKNRFGLDPDF